MKRIVLTIAVGLSLAGCSAVEEKYVEWEYVKPESFPVINAIGYAQVSRQHGRSDTEKMLNAIKASKLDAYRELAEQVHGQHLSGNMSVSDLMLQSDELVASVNGVIHGAKVVKSYPVGEDAYATELQLDMQNVYHILQNTAPAKRIKAVSYY